MYGEGLDVISITCLQRPVPSTLPWRHCAQSHSSALFAGSHRNQQTEWNLTDWGSKTQGNWGINRKNFSEIVHCVERLSSETFRKQEIVNNEITQNCWFFSLKKKKKERKKERKKYSLRIIKGDIQLVDTRGQGCIWMYWGGHEAAGTAVGEEGQRGTLWALDWACTDPCGSEWDCFSWKARMIHMSMWMYTHTCIFVCMCTDFRCCSLSHVSSHSTEFKCQCKKGQGVAF